MALTIYKKIRSEFLHPALVNHEESHQRQRTDAVVPLLYMLQGSQEVLALGTLIADETGAPVTYATEPNTTWFDRLMVRWIGILPVEWMM